MAEFETMRSTAAGRVGEIDEGLRTHMNKVYGTMSVGMLITALAAWAIAGLATTSDPALAAGQMANVCLATCFLLSHADVGLDVGQLWVELLCPVQVLHRLRIVLAGVVADTATAEA